MGDSLLLVLRVALSLALVLLLLWFLARRLGGRAGPSRAVPIDVVGRRALARRSGVAVVEVAGRLLLLGVSDGGVRLVADLGQPPRAAPDPLDAGVLEPSPLLADPPAPPVVAGAPAAGPPDFAGVLAGSVLDKETWARARQALTGRAGS
jgi:flagellar protein FliO/FliZ